MRPVLCLLPLTVGAVPLFAAAAEPPREVANGLPQLPAGNVSTRRLTRLEYADSIRELFGLSPDLSALLPEDGDDGATTPRGAILLPPAQQQRYRDAARAVLDQAIVTPPLERRFGPGKFVTADGKALVEGSFGEDTDISVVVSILAEGDYVARVSVEAVSETPVSIALKIDGTTTHRFIAPAGAPTPEVSVLRLTRGDHTISLRASDGEARLGQLSLVEKSAAPAPEQLAAHTRIFGDARTAWRQAATPDTRRTAAAKFIRAFADRAFRRRASEAEMEGLLSLYDASAARAEPFEESVKLALQAVLVSPHFLFRPGTPPPRTPGPKR